MFGTTTDDRVQSLVLVEVESQSALQELQGPKSDQAVNIKQLLILYHVCITEYHLTANFIVTISGLNSISFTFTRNCAKSYSILLTQTTCLLTG